MENSCIVIGSGWSAVAASSFLAAAGKTVVWLDGSGSRILPPLPTAEQGHGAEAWEALARIAGCAPHPGLTAQTGIFLREFHQNKSFVPIDPAERPEGSLAPEAYFWGLREHQLDRPLARIEALLRESLTVGSLSERVTRIGGGVPISAIEISGDRANDASAIVKMADGQSLSARKLVFCDHWTEAKRLGLAVEMLRRRHHSYSVIQATFHFKQPLTAAIEQGLVIRLPRDSAEDAHRLAFGQVAADGMSTTWTIFADAEEGEDNAFIAGKIRKLKRSLEKVFLALQQPFTGNLSREQVRLEENFFRSDWLDLEKSPVVAPAPDATSPLVLAFDAWGPSRSVGALVTALNAELGETLTESATDKELVFTENALPQIQIAQPESEA